MDVALGALRWSTWALTKQDIGQDMGDYPMAMWKYMKDYYKIIEEMGALKGLDD